MRVEINRFLITVLRFHGDVLLTSPLINEIKRINPESVIDLLVYKGTGVLFEGDERINNILEVEPSSSASLTKRLIHEIQLLRKLRKAKYDYGLFLTTQWRLALIGRFLTKIKTAGVDDLKRRKPFWIKSFSTIFPHVGNGHIIERNLSALKALGFQVNQETPKLSLKIPPEEVDSGKKIRSKNLIVGDYYFEYQRFTRGDAHFIRIELDPVRIHCHIGMWRHGDICKQCLPAIHPLAPTIHLFRIVLDPTPMPGQQHGGHRFGKGIHRRFSGISQVP